MTLKILCTLNNFQFEEVNNGLYYYYEGLVMSSNRDIIKESFSDPTFKSVFGNVLLLNAHNYPFFYLIDSAENNLPNDKTERYQVISSMNYSFHSIVRDFFAFLWFVKDNSANLYYTLDFCVEDGYGGVAANDFVCYSAKGTLETVSFNMNEIGIALEILNKVKTVSERKYIKSVEVDPQNLEKRLSKFESQDYNSTNRIDRALMFLGYARNSPFLPTKIAFYMSLFETLFSTDSEQLSHKVAERTAKYIVGTSTEQLETFNTIKKAYTVRSKFFHGDKLGKEGLNNSLLDLSVKIDNLTRKILTKVIMTDSEKFTSATSNDQLMAWFNSLLFS